MAQESSINGLVVIVMAIVMVGVFLAASVFIMDEFKDEESLHKTSGLFSQNLTALGNEPVTLNQDELVSFQMQNSTRDVTIAGSEYVLDSDAGTIAFTVAAALNGTDVAVNYTFNYESYATNASISALTALAEVGDWLDLVVIVAIAAIIIFLIASFGLRSGRR